MPALLYNCFSHVHFPPLPPHTSPAIARQVSPSEKLLSLAHTISKAQQHQGSGRKKGGDGKKSGGGGGAAAPPAWLSDVLSCLTQKEPPTSVPFKWLGQLKDFAAKAGTHARWHTAAPHRTAPHRTAPHRITPPASSPSLVTRRLCRKAHMQACVLLLHCWLTCHLLLTMAYVQLHFNTSLILLSPYHVIVLIYRYRGRWAAATVIHPRTTPRCARMPNLSPPSLSSSLSLSRSLDLDLAFALPPPSTLILANSTHLTPRQHPPLHCCPEQASVS